MSVFFYWISEKQRFSNQGTSMFVTCTRIEKEIKAHPQVIQLTSISD